MSHFGNWSLKNLSLWKLFTSAMIEVTNSRRLRFRRCTLSCTQTPQLKKGPHPFGTWISSAQEQKLLSSTHSSIQHIPQINTLFSSTQKERHSKKTKKGQKNFFRGWIWVTLLCWTDVLKWGGGVWNWRGPISKWFIYNSDTFLK